MGFYYVRPTNGSNGNAGTSFAAAWQTTQYALDNCHAGDYIYLCAEAVEQTSSQIDIDTKTGNINSWITLEGRDGVDGTTPAQYTIQRTGSSGLLMVANTFNVEYFNFKNITFDGNSIATTCFTNTASNSVVAFHFANCRFTGSAGIGLQHSCASNQNPWVFTNCQFDNNSSDGYSGFSVYGTAYLQSCVFNDNGRYGANVADSSHGTVNCIFYGNTSDGLYLDTNSDTPIIDHCTFYNNSGNGININTTSCEGWIISSCAFVSNGGYGINKLATKESESVDYNLFYNNTSGHCNLVSDANINDGTVGWNNQTTDPSFTNAAGNDFTPSSVSSPLVGNAPNNGTIGALGVVTASSGGGTVAHAI